LLWGYRGRRGRDLLPRAIVRAVLTRAVSSCLVVLTARATQSSWMPLFWLTARGRRLYTDPQRREVSMHYSKHGSGTNAPERARAPPLVARSHRHRSPGVSPRML
jgi:hypothetical protein